jgi:hypothetical protein
MDIALISNELSGNIKYVSVIHPTHCSNKAILRTRSNDVDHISEEILESLDGQILPSCVYGHPFRACLDEERNVPDLHVP